jgi:hypothetical protein
MYNLTMKIIFSKVGKGEFISSTCAPTFYLLKQIRNIL